VVIHNCLFACFRVIVDLSCIHFSMMLMSFIFTCGSSVELFSMEMPGIYCLGIQINFPHHKVYCLRCCSSCPQCHLYCLRCVLYCLLCGILSPRLWVNCLWISITLIFIVCIFYMYCLQFQFMSLLWFLTFDCCSHLFHYCPCPLV